jgi:hypothetical protein
MMLKSSLYQLSFFVVVWTEIDVRRVSCLESFSGTELFLGLVPFSSMSSHFLRHQAHSYSDFVFRDMVRQFVFTIL